MFCGFGYFYHGGEFVLCSFGRQVSKFVGLMSGSGAKCCMPIMQQTNIVSWMLFAAVSTVYQELPGWWQRWLWRFQILRAAGTKAFHRSWTVC